MPPHALDGEARKGGRAKILAPLAVVALLAAAGGAYALTRGGGDQAGGETTSTTEGGTSGFVNAVASAENMVQIPAGTYTLGVDKPEPNAAETLTLTKEVAAFYIDLYEVSNEEFNQFVNEKQAAPPASWPGGRYPGDGQALRPVQGVSYQWASAYCASLGKRLPTEAEWETAARGTEARLFPWGAVAAEGGLPDEGTYDRGSMAANASTFGVFDLTGNVWEWVGDSYDPRVDESLHVLRGGQNGYLRKNTVRLPVADSSNALKIAGFRCAADTADAALPALQFGDFTVPELGNEVTPTTTPPGVILDDTFDDATSGWVELTTDEIRYGYHPNGFFHLETKKESTDVSVESSVALQADRPAKINVSAFVDPANTNDDGGVFSYGILFRSSINGDGNGLIFVVDPRSQKWQVCNRDPDTGKWVLIEQKQRAIPDTADLEVRMKGDTYEFLIGGQQVYARDIPGYTGSGAGMVLVSYQASTKAHIHFDKFRISEL
ncbi:MAG: SUMF1/EgtB/PvdO family nonheme iron enzyme [Acidimicrobiales bacterium]|nr:SUMF1/EgtB/PvdO family nonheme iron enzyme [Acidimicrobiales bacterium]